MTALRAAGCGGGDLRVSRAVLIYRFEKIGRLGWPE